MTAFHSPVFTRECFYIPLSAATFFLNHLAGRDVCR